MASRLKDKVIVITGASSGIGRATALRLAEKCAKVVACARREEPLHSLQQECERLRGECEVCVTDVTDLADLERAVRHAVDRFGRIDGFVNNAGSFMVGKFEDTPSEAVRQLLEVNLFGVMNGCRAVLPHFRAQGRGVLVNVASVYGDVPGPFVSAYVASKFAVRGFSASLRQELLGSGIEVCTVLPAAIDTPLYEHSPNYSGLEIKPIPPLYPPEKVAKVICRVLVRPDDEVFAGGAGPVFSAVHKVMPETQERMMAKVVEHQHFTDQPAPATHGSLYHPMDAGQTAGGGYRGGLRQWVKRALLIAVVPAGIAAVRRALQ